MYTPEPVAFLHPQDPLEITSLPSYLLASCTSWAREETSRKFRGTYLHYEEARVSDNACSYRCEYQLHSHEAACTKNAYFLRTPL